MLNARRFMKKCVCTVFFKKGRVTGVITNGHREIDTLHVAFLDENLTALAADGAHLVLRDQLAPPQLLNRAVKIGRHLSWRWMCLKGEREVVAVRAYAKKKEEEKSVRHFP